MLLLHIVVIFLLILVSTRLGMAAEQSTKGMESLRKLLPVLTMHLRKGDMGKIAIIGGSKEYTGAPYYAAHTVVNMGADLIFVFCSPEAAPIIKGYSPDFIVHPTLEPEFIISKLSRMDAIVVGPGLGRDPALTTLMRRLTQFVKETEKPFVVDGDGLWFYSENQTMLPPLPSTILTPNFMEFARLCKSALQMEVEDVIKIRDEEEIRKIAMRLSEKLGVSLFVKKGTDILVNPEGGVTESNALGSPRRVGGQGDTTAGSLGLLLYWARKAGLEWKDAKREAFLASAWLVRESARRAFETEGRPMTTSHVIREIAHVIRTVDGGRKSEL